MTGPAKVSPPKTYFAARLREAQKASGLSNRELCRELDISESLLAKYKRGDSHPGFENAARLARALDKPLDFFTDHDADPVAA